MKKVIITHKRRFSPHNTLIGAARAALASAEKKESGWAYDRLTAITFSALAIEALANAVGERIVSDWSDFESLSPMGKLRVICDKQNITIDWTIEPWSGTRWLVAFRNKVAHAKPEAITDRSFIPEQTYQKSLYRTPGAKLEAELTAGNARRSVEVFDELLVALCSGLRINQKIGITSDFSSGKAESYEAG